jgi:hypothetical protein
VTTGAQRGRAAKPWHHGGVDLVTLPDGAEVEIRPIGPGDAPELQRGLEHLGPRSRHRRFLGTPIAPARRASGASRDWSSPRTRRCALIARLGEAESHNLDVLVVGGASAELVQNVEIGALRLRGGIGTAGIEGVGRSAAGPRGAG